MAHQGCFPLDGYTTRNLVAAVVHILQGGGDDIHVIVGIHTAGDAQTQQVESAETVLAGYGVAVGKNVANLTTADASLKVELAGERLCGELFFRHVAQHLVGIDEQGMTTHGALVGDAILVEFLGQVFYLMDTCLEHVELGVLVESHGQCIQVAAIESAIGEESFEGDAELFGTLIPFLAVGGNESAHVHQSVFLGRHGHSVYIRVHLACNLLDGLVGVALFALLDEVAVLCKAGRVHHHRHMIFVAQLAGLADVLHRYRLSAHGVVGHGEHHERHVARILLQHLLQFLERHIPLEWYFELGVFGFVDGHVDGLGLAELNVALGGVKVGIAGHHVAFFHQIGEQHVLGGTSLMGGDDILETEDALHHRLELIERCGTGIALIAEHHLRPLAVAHGTGARVGQAVDVHLFCLQHEYVVMGFFQPLFSFLTSALAERFYHFDFPSFCEWYFHSCNVV